LLSSLLFIVSERYRVQNFSFHLLFGIQCLLRFFARHLVLENYILCVDLPMRSTDFPLQAGPQPPRISQCAHMITCRRWTNRSRVGLLSSLLWHNGQGRFCVLEEVRPPARHQIYEISHTFTDPQSQDSTPWSIKC